jgi:hypothetical protein
MSQSNEGNNHRQSPRAKLAAMYTHLRVRPAGGSRYRWSGFVYDISASGMHFELDDQIDSGTALEVRITLPGSAPTTLSATGTVVRTHDDEPGPVRMGLHFDDFRTENDRKRLVQYLDTPHLKAA